MGIGKEVAENVKKSDQVVITKTEKCELSLFA